LDAYDFQFFFKLEKTSGGYSSVPHAFCKEVKAFFKRNHLQDF